ncbi:MAG: hypothetical protein ACYDAI_08045 [Trichloromonadaceae bacterium]
MARRSQKGLPPRSVNLYVVPHFQVEGVDVRLNLVAQMPKAEG